jgi:hypothetical protein
MGPSDNAVPGPGDGRRHQESLHMSSRFEHRLKKLETKLAQACANQAEVPELTRTDTEWADWVGDLLWWPKGAHLDHWPRFSSSAGQRDGPLRAWHQAAEQAFQQGQRDYHADLRPVSMEVWLSWKHAMLRQLRTCPQSTVNANTLALAAITIDEFSALPVAEQTRLLRG